MSLGKVAELATVVRRDSQAVLVVVSEIPNLQFESTRKIHETRQNDENEWHIFLQPDRQIITMRVAGYMPVKTEVTNFKVKRAYQLKVSQKKREYESSPWCSYDQNQSRWRHNEDQWSSHRCCYPLSY